MRGEHIFGLVLLIRSINQDNFYAYGDVYESNFKENSSDKTLFF